MGIRQACIRDWVWVDRPAHSDIGLPKTDYKVCLNYVPTMQCIDSGPHSITVTGNNAPVGCLQAANQHREEVECCYYKANLHANGSSNENFRKNYTGRRENCSSFIMFSSPVTNSLLD